MGHKRSNPPVQSLMVGSDPGPLTGGRASARLPSGHIKDIEVTENTAHQPSAVTVQLSHCQCVCVWEGRTSFLAGSGSSRGCWPCARSHSFLLRPRPGCQVSVWPRWRIPSYSTSKPTVKLWLVQRSPFIKRSTPCREDGPVPNHNNCFLSFILRF